MIFRIDWLIWLKQSMPGSVMPLAMNYMIAGPDAWRSKISIQIDDLKIKRIVYMRKFEFKPLERIARQLVCCLSPSGLIIDFKKGDLICPPPAD